MDFLEFKTTEQLYTVYNHAHVYDQGVPYVDENLMSRPLYGLFSPGEWCDRLHNVPKYSLRALQNFTYYTVYPRYVENQHDAHWFPQWPHRLIEEFEAVYYFVYPVVEVHVREPLKVPALHNVISPSVPVGPNTLQVQVKQLDRQFVSILDLSTPGPPVSSTPYDNEIFGIHKRKLRKPYEISSISRQDVFIPLYGKRTYTLPPEEVSYDCHYSVYVGLQNSFHTLHSETANYPGIATYYALNFGAYRSALPTWSDNNQLDLINKVYERIKGTSFNIPTTVGAEGRETILYLVKRLESFQKLMLGVKTRNVLMISEALGLVDKKTNRRWHRAGGSIITDPQAKRQFVSARGIADLWMEWRYAIRPLIHDIDELANALKSISFKQPDRKVSVRLRVKHSGKAIVYGGHLYIVEDENEFRERLGTDIPWGGPFYFTMKWELFIKKGCVVKVLANTIDWVAIFGLLSWKQALWEAVPYSFVVDWFKPIGRWLQASENIQTVHIEPPETSYIKEQWYFSDVNVNLIQSYLLSAESAQSIQQLGWEIDAFRLGQMTGGTHIAAKGASFKRFLDDPHFLRLPPSPDGVSIEGAFQWQRAADLGVLASNIIETLQNTRKSPTRGR